MRWARSLCVAALQRATLPSSSRALPMHARCMSSAAERARGTVFRHVPEHMLEKLSAPVDAITAKELEASPGYDELDTGGLVSDKDFSSGDDKITKWQQETYKKLKLNHITAEVKRVVHVNKKGRLSRMSALVVVGNGNGSIGFAVGKADTTKGAINKAKFKAMTSLQTIERYDNRTILYPVDGKYGASKLRMRPVTDGYGVVAHHLVVELCALVGITDISVTHLGSRNRLNVVRAAFECFSQLMSIKDYCIKNRLNAIDFRRVMNRHSMFAARAPVRARRRQRQIMYQRELPSKDLGP